MPGLEEAFDLRPNGTWSRRILETPAEKTVEITIRRWQMPSPVLPPQPQFGPTSMGNHPQQTLCSPSLQYHPQAAWAMSGHAAALGAVAPPQSGMFGANGTCPTAACQGQYSAVAGSCSSPFYSQMLGASAASECQAAAACAALATAAAEDQATGRLARLESALSMLKPQIEALLASQMKQSQCQAPFASSMATSMAAPADASPPTRASVSAVDQLLAQPLPQPYVAQPQPLMSMQVPFGTPQQYPAQHVASQCQPPPPVVEGLAGSADTATSTVPIESSSAAAPANGLAVTTAEKARGQDDDGHELRARRHMVQLQIQTSPKDRVVEKAKKQGMPMTSMPSNNSQRPRVNINAVRVAPSAADPASPRSPGRYSAWKS
eukprot:TRINITY_DN49528_c0_g1_i1.p1 TRINITY_DN49528_c0_g1~~TRINITY_DN49528_c0_g1_i1.p1  ORF type:complete len:401 (+),score=70.81 TRINITY_DN49528_c0_g1_i1:70-1203(+)